MKVDIWFDYACPFCYIGKRRLEAAIAEFTHTDQIEVHYHSYQLEPDAPRERNSTIHEHIAAKYGTTVDYAKKMNEPITEQAREAGLIFRFDTMIPTNTADAHRLTHYAESNGKGAEMTERLFKAYFSDSLHIGDHSTLLKVAKEIGLPEKEALDVLEKGYFTEQMNKDIQTGVEIGIQGVPFFVFNNKYAISGAQSITTLKEILRDVWEEEQDPTSITFSKKQNISEYCTDDECYTA